MTIGHFLQKLYDPLIVSHIPIGNSMGRNFTARSLSEGNPLMGGYAVWSMMKLLLHGFEFIVAGATPELLKANLSFFPRGRYVN